MKKLFIAGFIGAVAAIFLLVIYMRNSNVVAPIVGGFTDAQIQDIEQSIRDYYLRQLRESQSPTEREEVASGSTTVEAQMLKVSDKRLEGFVKFTMRDEASRKLGLGEIILNCEATMNTDSTKWLWKCQNK